MLTFQDKLLKYNKNDENLNILLSEIKKGSFWHWRRTYALRMEDNRIYIIQLNIFERIYANLVGCGIENFFKKTFSSRKIVGLASENEIDLLIYNTSKSILIDKNAGLDKIYHQIEAEAVLWRGRNKINLQTPSPYLNGPLQRIEWWGRFAQTVGGTGLNASLEKVIQTDKGLALDIGCGNSESALYLLQKGWSVICLDYSEDAITVMKNRADQINQEWLKTNQLILTCSAIENYQWPTKIDLVLASSALPYFDPQKIKSIMTNIYQNLNPGGHFIGNFFASKYVGTAMDVTREIGAWFVDDKETVGYFLNGLGYEVIECANGGQQNSHSVVFIAKK
jgi:SAM-dependent methyltransferase